MRQLLSAPWVWDADPVMAHFGDIPIRWYTALFLVGMVIAERMITRTLRKHGLPKDHAGPLLLWTLGCALLGAHLVHVVFYDTHALLSDPMRIFRFGAGLASHGGAVGGIVGAYVCSRRYKVEFFRATDITTFGFYCAIPLVRIGNFFNSEIVGRPTDLPWGVVFVRRGFTEPRHPSQLYEALLGAVFIAFCIWLEHRWGKRLRPGLLMFLMPGLYCVTRFFIEFVKEYQTLESSFPLTMGQLLSIPVVLFCAGMIWWKKLYMLSSPEEPARQEAAASPKG